MTRKILIAALGMAGLTLAGAAQAFNFGNMMNPSRWFGGNNDDYYDRGYYRYGPYGGGPWGYGGYGPYGWGGGGPWGYPGGYGGYGGYGGGAPSTIVVTPQSGESKAPPPPRVPE